MKRAHPRRIFITGASSGIGEALADAYAAPGVHLGLLARRAELLEAVARRCRGKGAEALVLVADVGDRTAMAAAAQRYLAWAGGSDLVIANAGGGDDDGDLIDPTLLAETLRRNVVGVIHTLLPFVPAMRQAGAGQLASVASLAGLRALPTSPSYSASKAALISLTESLRVRLLGTGIAVSTVCPGFVRTLLTAKNPRMAWVLEPAEAARLICDGLARGKSTIAFPWKLAALVRLLRVLPDGVYDRVARKMLERSEAARAQAK